MAQVIYTGENYRKYVPSQGKTLQALSQYAQQNTYKKEREKERQREDRNLLAEAFKMDPVYASELKIQEQMSQITDKFMQEAAVLEKQISQEGKLSTESLMKVERLKAQTASQIGHLSSLDKEIQTAATLARKNPRVHSPKKFAEALAEYQRTGIRPKEGFSFQTVYNPIDVYLDYVKKARGPVVDVGDPLWVKNKDDTGYFVNQKGYQETKSEADFIKSFGMSESGQYYIQNWFDDEVNPGTRQDYLKKAGGDNIAAADMWFEDEVKGKAYPTWRDTSSLKSPRVASASAATKGITQSNGIWYNNGKPMMSTQENYPAMSGERLGSAIVFDNQYTNTKRGADLPPDIILFPKGVEPKGIDNLRGYPTAADKTKTYWKVDGKSISNIVTTTNGMKALEEAGMGNYDKEGDKFIFKQDAEGMVTVTTRTSDALAALNAMTDNSAGYAISQLPGEAKEIPYPVKEEAVKPPPEPKKEPEKKGIGERVKNLFNRPKKEEVKAPPTKTSTLPVDWYIDLPDEDDQKIRTLIKNNPDKFEGGPSSEGAYAKAAKILLDKGYIIVK